MTGRPGPAAAAPHKRSRRATVSAVLIVKDEQDVLARCLESVRWADQIVVYDTGSTDATVQIARTFTDTVIEGYWDQDFAAARNRALAYATSEWVLSIDADEVFESEPATLRKHLARDGVGAYGIRVLNLSGNPLQQDMEFTAPRVFRRVDHHWVGRLHEQIHRADGQVAAVAVLRSVRLVHSGYADATTNSTVKADRNIGIARAQLAAAIAAGDQDEVISSRVHLVRSLRMGDRHQEADELADEVWAVGGMPLQMADNFIETQVALMLAIGDADGADRWLGRWREYVGDNHAVRTNAAKLALLRDDPQEALRQIESIPVQSLAPDGGILRRRDVADLEVQVLDAVGRHDDALALVRRSLREGSTRFSSVDVFQRFGPDAFAALLELLDAGQWRMFAMHAYRVDGPLGLAVLAAMDAARPGDLTVVGCALNLVPQMTLEQAGEWSAKARRMGLVQQCPLLALAALPDRPPRDRALAAALAWSAYRDQRALEPLQRALDEVPPEQEAQLAAELDIVAPDLVAAG